MSNVERVKKIFFIQNIKYTFSLIFVFLRYLFKLSTTIVRPFFVYIKIAMCQVKNRAFRVIQQYEHHMYSESPHEEQSYKKYDMSCI